MCRDTMTAGDLLPASFRSKLVFNSAFLLRVLNGFAEADVVADLSYPDTICTADKGGGK